MADNKKITPLNVPKVKRGAKNALTPGEQPEKEKRLFLVRLQKL